MSDIRLGGRKVHVRQCDRCGLVVAAWAPPDEVLPDPVQWECSCPACDNGWITWSSPAPNGICTGYPEPAANGADLTHNLRAAVASMDRDREHWLDTAQFDDDDDVDYVPYEDMCREVAGALGRCIEMLKPLAWPTTQGRQQ